MTDLSKLTVSLTKHGAHKIAILLRKYPKDDLLLHLEGSEGVNIDLAQAKKNLAANRHGTVPDLWNEAQHNGRESIDALVLIAIILSHHQLIHAIRNSNARNRYAGTVRRSQFQNDKAFTNLAHTIEELGYSTEHSQDHVRYDLQKLFQIPGLHTLFEKLLRLKLIAAGWDEKNSIIDESIRLRLHEVFSLTKKQFGTWLVTGSLTTEDLSKNVIEDQEFFTESDDDLPVGKFEFCSGHNNKKTGVAATGDPLEPRTAMSLLHNEIQNQMYESLIAKYGNECVGTENQTGDGTTIDIVVKTDQFCWFYEIKTDSSVRVCIRQAIPQLLEYAYWQCDRNRADKLIIVSTSAITKQASEYLDFLQKQFKLNIYYEQFQIKPHIPE